MTSEEALDFARAELTRVGLAQWSVHLGNAKRQLGLCRYHDKRIVLARRLVSSGQDDLIKDVIWHEVAHALAGPSAKHGPKWKKIALSLGANPSSRASAEALPAAPAPWVGRCPTCGAERHLYRPPRRVVSCGACSTNFESRHVLNWFHHGAPTTPPGAYTRELRHLERQQK